MDRRSGLRALQIEVSSRCTRRCRICPQKTFQDQWKAGLLDHALWDSVQSALPEIAHVHLQGWGEPLLHPRLPEMVHDAKAAGCTAGITTNGDRLSDASQWILEHHVDLLTISVAGATNDQGALRDGVPFEAVLARIRDFQSQNPKRRGHTKLQVSYLLTKDNAAELPAAIVGVADAGADAMFVIHVDVTPTPEVFQTAAFQPDCQEAVARHVRHAATIAKKARLPFRPPTLKPYDALTCALDPRRFAFISHDGRVGPCVNLLLPIDGPIARWDHCGLHRITPVVYGHLGPKSLTEILNSPQRLAFLNNFQKRLEAEQLFHEKIPLECGTEALRTLEKADNQRETTLKANPFPVACTGCHKRWGW